MLNIMKGRITALSQWKQSSAWSRRDHTIAPPKEQDMLRERIGVYPRRWLGWAGMLVLVWGVSGCTEEGKWGSDEAMGGRRRVSRR